MANNFLAFSGKVNIVSDKIEVPLTKVILLIMNDLITVVNITGSIEVILTHPKSVYKTLSINSLFR